MSEASAPASKTIGDQLVAYCRDGKNLECINTLYADDVVSIEAAEGGAGPRVTKGKEGVIGKNTWWQENMEVRRANVDGPFPPRRRPLRRHLRLRCEEQANRRRDDDEGSWRISP
ncbi:MAG: hypothetical protein AAF938_10075 [Myxococcota bacterium]